jgi:hypothetical protein
MHTKKGQVAIFIIMAIVLVLVLIVAFFFTGAKDIGLKTGIVELNAINLAFEDCIISQATSALSLIGISGGYIEPLNNFEETEIGKVSYALKNKQTILITKSDLEKEISNYVTSTIRFCILSRNYPQLVIEQQDAQVTTSVKQNEVIVSAIIPIIVTKGDQTVTANIKHEIELSVRMGKIIDMVNGIIIKQKQARDSIPLTYLSGLDAETSFSYHTDSIILYVLFDEGSILDDVQYSFSFLAELQPEVKRT